MGSAARCMRPNTMWFAGSSVSRPQASESNDGHAPLHARPGAQISACLTHHSRREIARLPSRPLDLPQHLPQAFQTLARRFFPSGREHTAFGLTHDILRDRMADAPVSFQR
jgi:hypothetical protein